MTGVLGFAGVPRSSPGENHDHQGTPVKTPTLPLRFFYSSSAVRF